MENIKHRSNGILISFDLSKQDIIDVNYKKVDLKGISFDKVCQLVEDEMPHEIKYDPNCTSFAKELSDEEIKSFLARF